jgi:hypothetical protein
VVTVLAATDWRTNAEIIEACAELGYLKSTDLILDPTCGRGRWWTRWRPAAPVVTADLHAGRKTQGSVRADCRALPFKPGHFDVVAYDPPYVSTGGRVTSTLDDFNDRFGLTDTPRSPAALQTMINDGITQAHQVLRPRGILLVKAATYVSSGRLWLGSYWTLHHALDVGFACRDIFQHVGRAPRPQPERSRADGEPVRQHHARQNYSTLFVLQRGANP